MRLAMLQFERQLLMCMRKGITIFKILLCEVGWKSRFTAPLMRRRKTKFSTIYPSLYLPKWKFWIQLSPNSQVSDQRHEGPLVSLIYPLDLPVFVFSRLIILLMSGHMAKSYPKMCGQISDAKCTKMFISCLLCKLLPVIYLFFA